MKVVGRHEVGEATVTGAAAPNSESPQLPVKSARYDTSK